MSCSKQKEVLLSVIDTYKDMPYLWKTDHKDYMKKDVRAEGFKVLLEIYKKFDEKATIKTLKKKIENMRTSYAKELKKVLGSKHTGARTYVPSLWYFEALSFLGGRTESFCIVTDPLKNENSSSDEETPSVATSSSGQQKRIRKDTLLQEQEKIVLSAEKIMSQKEEELEVYCRSIGFQMKALNERQLMITQKMISDVIFYARLNKLNESSYVVLNPSNEPRFSQFYSASPQSYTSSPPPSHEQNETYCKFST